MIAQTCFCVLLFLSGCGVGPHYKKPQVHLPEKYSIDLLKSNKDTLRKWWTSFEDAQLENLINIGLSSNFDLKIALEKIEESRNLFNIQTANLLPQVNFFTSVLEANLGNGIFAPRNSVTGNITSEILAIDTLWEIDIWGRLRKNRKAAYYQWESQIEDMRDVLIMLTAEIAQTYINICSLEQKLNILQSTFEIDKKLVTLYKDTFNAGLDNKQIPLEQRTSIDQSQAQIIDLEVDQEKAIHKLAFLLGKTPDQLNLDWHAINSVPEARKEVYVEKPYQLLRRRPDIRKSERLLAASYEQIGAAMAEWFPKISLLGFLGKPFTSGCGIVGGNERIWAVGPLINWPFLDFGRIYFNIKAKESSQRQAELSYKKAVINAVKEVEDWLVSYVEEKNKLRILDEKKASEKKRLALTNDSFVSGIESNVAFLLNQKRFNEIALEQVDSQEKVASNYIALYKALGGDW